MFDFIGNKTGLIPYLVAGDKGLATTEVLANALIDEGASALEIGVPFSDALADGPVIQRACERAVSSGVTLQMVLELIARLSRRNAEFPFIVFSYFNPIFAFGPEKYVRLAKAAGVYATLIVDLPIEESQELLSLHNQYDLDMIFLASPTTRRDRLREIARVSNQFIYYVSRTGVTGENSRLSQTLFDEIRFVREITDCPLAVGFGISTPEQVAKLRGEVEAVVVGSAFVRLVEVATNTSEAETSVRQLAKKLIAAMQGHDAEVHL